MEIAMEREREGPASGGRRCSTTTSSVLARLERKTKCSLLHALPASGKKALISVSDKREIVDLAKVWREETDREERGHKWLSCLST
jgi:hypothetical protein